MTVHIDYWLPVAFRVMRSSNGGVTYDAIMHMTFPDLAELWAAAVSFG